jgi:pilus assembly protein CpaC
VSGVDFKPFGTTVRFLPLVLGGGKIYLEVEPQFTFPDPTPLFSAPVNGGTVFGRTTQRVQTSAVLEDGQTLAIGGMLFTNINGTATKVPVLGDLPWVGAAFREMKYNESEEELLILVTPHLVDAMACNQVPRCLPGEETRKPDDYELFLEGILEAPRGQRWVFQCGDYVPAYKNGPTGNMFPCPNCNGPRGACDFGACNGPPCPPGGYCGNGACANGSCANGACPVGGFGPMAVNGAVKNQPATTVAQPLPAAAPKAPVQQTQTPVQPSQTPAPQMQMPAPQMPAPPQQLPETRTQVQPPAEDAPIRAVPVAIAPVEATPVKDLPVSSGPVVEQQVQPTSSFSGATLAMPTALEDGQ